MAPITTEVATMAAKCTGWISFAIINGMNSGATTTVTEMSSIRAPATTSTEITNMSAMSGEFAMAWTATVKSCGIHSDDKIREIISENSRINIIEPVVSAACTVLFRSEAKVNSR